MKHTGNYESSRRSNTLRCSDFRVKLYVDSAPEKADHRMPKVQDWCSYHSQSLRQKDGDKYDTYPMYVTRGHTLVLIAFVAELNSLFSSFFILKYLF